ncbi:MAG: flippase-like domain-containing protein, partial [Christensenellales bacterium]
LLNKMHIIKNYKVTFFKVARFVKSYQRSIKDFSKSVWTILLQLFFAFFTYFATYTLAYLIYLAFLPLNPAPVIVSWADVLCCAVLCDLCAGIIPLPGGTGMAEISFDNLFKRLFSLTVFPWALMIWRTFTYFIYIVIGGVSMSFSFLKFNKKNNNKK